jgi:SAM-dependent methyltransferase
MRATVTTIVQRVRRGFKPANRRPAPQIVSADGSELAQVGTTWERLAQIDPLWAVLSEPDKKGRRWVAEEFLASGEAEVANLLADLEKLGFSARGEAVDFGCGAGRLSIALARRFDHVTSIDISPTMLEIAEQFAGSSPSITFVHNARPDLVCLADSSVDLAYSNIVLQHMDAHLAVGYLQELARALRPDGVLAFQLPSHLRDDYLPNGNNLTRLPPEAMVSRVEVADVPPVLASGTKCTLGVTVVNCSEVEWEQDLSNTLNVGNHWHSVDGADDVYNDGRTRLPGRTPPGVRVDLDLTVTAPQVPGRYDLVIDVVQENVSWFEIGGAAVTIRSVQVVEAVDPSARRPSAEGAPPASPVEYPVFMMQGIPRDEVEDLLARLGLELLQVDEHVTEWFSYRYIARKLPVP